ncbi:hypothetical protein ACFU5O_00840 [Streptomyces sp. NPDC057445]|uniref:hypothetical protein n=1 Tax=Streptomyces sp. NPDC057445 TaxID=3346136 RepID=UPI003680CBF9
MQPQLHDRADNLWALRVRGFAVAPDGSVYMNLPRPSMLSAVLFGNLLNLAHALPGPHHAGGAVATGSYLGCLILAILAGRAVKSATSGGSWEPLPRVLSIILGAAATAADGTDALTPWSVAVIAVMGAITLWSEGARRLLGGRSFAVPVIDIEGVLTRRPLRLPQPGAHSGVFFFGLATLARALLDLAGAADPTTMSWAYGLCAVLAMAGGQVAKSKASAGGAERGPRSVSAVLATAAVAVTFLDGEAPGEPLTAALGLSAVSITCYLLSRRSSGPGGVRGPGTEPGTEPGAEPGAEPPADPGAEPGAEPPADPGTEPGTEPPADPGTEPGAETGHRPAGARSDSTE